MIEVDSIDYPSGMRELNPIWEELLARSPEKTVFLTPEWIDLSCRHLLKKGSRPYLLLARDASGPLGLAPLYLKAGPRENRLCLFFHDHMEHPNFILTREPERCLQAFFITMGRNFPHLKRITLKDCPDDSTTWSFLTSGALKESFTILSRPVYQSPFIPIKGPFDAYLKQRPAEFQRNVRRMKKKIAQAGQVEYERMDGRETAREAMEWILAIEARSWKNAAGTSIGSDKRVESFYRDLIRTAAIKGWLHLTFLKLNGVPIAYFLGFLYHNQFSGLKTSYDQDYRSLSPGVNLQLQVYQEGFEKKWGKIDLLGNKDFLKGRFTDRIRPHTTFELYPKGPISELRRFYHSHLRPVWKKLAAPFFLYSFFIL